MKTDSKWTYYIQKIEKPLNLNQVDFNTNGIVDAFIKIRYHSKTSNKNYAYWINQFFN